MTGDVVNLRAARKARARKAAEDRAAANRARFGRTSGERTREDQEAARRAKLLEGARREE